MVVLVGAPGAVGAVGLIHLDRVSPVRYRPVLGTPAGTGAGRSRPPRAGAHHLRRCLRAGWIVLLCLGAPLLARFPVAAQLGIVAFAVVPASVSCMTAGSCRRTKTSRGPRGRVLDVTFLRVLLIDGHKMLTDTLAARLSTATDMWVVGSATIDDPRLAEIVATLRPDVVTTEVAPVPGETAGLLRSLSTARPSARLVLLTGDDDTAHAVAAAREGAAAWVSKRSSVDHLLGVLRAVNQGHACYPPRQLGAVLRELRDDVRAARSQTERLSVLSDREREVLLRMIDGKPVSQIAMESLVSTNTVRTHVRSILTKLGVHSRLEAVSVARGAGLRPTGDHPTPRDPFSRDHPPRDYPSPRAPSPPGRLRPLPRQRSTP